MVDIDSMKNILFFFSSIDRSVIVCHMVTVDDSNSVFPCKQKHQRYEKKMAREFTFYVADMIACAVWMCKCFVNIRQRSNKH